MFLKQNIKLSQCLAPSKSVGANQLSVKSEKVQGREGGREGGKKSKLIDITSNGLASSTQEKQNGGVHWN